MTKFTDIKLGDEMYSVVFGLGKVIFVLDKPFRVDGYYVFEVEYKNGKKVHYTEDGKPGWCKDINNCSKTVHYKHEINFDNLDVSSQQEPLKKHKIIELRDLDMLEMLSPAGAWVDANLMPDLMVDEAIKRKEYALFRSMKEYKLSA